jgi:hypothetical protein
MQPRPNRLKKKNDDQSADVILLADVGVDKLGLRTERAQLRAEVS